MNIIKERDGDPITNKEVFYSIDLNRLKKKRVTEESLSKVANLPFEFSDFNEFKKWAQLSTMIELDGKDIILVSGGKNTGINCQNLRINVKYQMKDLNRIKEIISIDYAKCFVNNYKNYYGDRYIEEQSSFIGKDFLLASVSTAICICLIIYLLFHNKDLVNYYFLKMHKSDKIVWLIRKNQKASNLVNFFFYFRFRSGMIISRLMKSTRI